MCPHHVAAAILSPTGSVPGRWVAMQDRSLTESLDDHLGELCDLFASLQPQLTFAAAVYDAAGQLTACAGHATFPARLGALPDQSRDAPQALDLPDARPAVASILPTRSPEPLLFIVSGSLGTEARVLEGLCRMGCGFVARTIDLLDQAKALWQVAREQEAIIDHISDGLLVLDRSGILRYLNAPGGRILQLDPATSVGRPFHELLDFDPIIAPIFATRQGYIDRELHIRTRNVALHLMDTAVPIMGEDGTVVSIVNTFREMARVKRLSNRLAGDRARYRFSDIIGHSRAIKDAISNARRAARSNATVLLRGESGTGKEIFAQSIHNDGQRAAGPFVAVNCAALPRDLIESEMFGYAPGSFTGADKAGRPGRFELASGGTIFLDEISEMPLDVQAKLLRVLQERQVTRIGGTSSLPVDVRVIAAANRDLRELVAKQAFREDLYYRLNVVRIDLPALRERREDIARLADESIRRSCAVMHRPALSLGPRALRQLETHDWPGNVRQLQNLIERLVNMTDSDEVEDLPLDWLTDGPVAVQPSHAAEPAGRAMSLLEAEHLAIRAALAETSLNLTKAAELLGITRPTLYAKMKRFGLATSTQLVQR